MMHNISISEIPEYLSSSKFLSNLDNQNDDLISVQHYKPNTTINNLDDFISLIKVIEYWDADIPTSVWKYGFENQHKVCKAIRCLDNKELQKKYVCLTDNVICINSIVKHSNPNALKIYLEHFNIINSDDPNIYIIALQNNNNYKACTIATQNNDLESLKILHKHNFPLDYCSKHYLIDIDIHNICEFASKYNSLSCLVYGIENNCPLRDSISNSLIYGSIDVIEYFYLNFRLEVETILLENNDVMKDIFMNDSVLTLKFIFSKKIIYNKYLNIGTALRNGSLKCLEFLFLTLNFKVKLTDIENMHHLCNKDLHNSHIKCLKFLDANNWFSHEKRTIKIFFELIEHDITLLENLISMKINFNPDELFEYARKKNNIQLMIKLHKELNIPFPRIFSNLLPKNRNSTNSNIKKTYNGKLACFDYIRDNFV